MSKLTLIACAACLALGGYIGYGLHDTPQPEVISHMPVVIQSDASVILERVPAINVEPPHKIPKGAKVERQVTVTVKPAGDPVRVDLSLVQLDGGRRVIASSPDGEIVGGFDMPVTETLIPPPPRRWAAGLSYDPVGRHYGAWTERDLGRLRLGLDVRQDGAAVRAGFTF